LDTSRPVAATVGAGTRVIRSTEGAEYGSPDAAGSLVVPAGTELRLALETELGTEHSETDDRFGSIPARDPLRSRSGTNLQDR